ncbi:hypothetical protein ACUR5C_11450 [Aliikangiella sp. IMCC44653]
MAKKDIDMVKPEDKVTWTSEKIAERSGEDRRTGEDRRQLSGRAITVPDMRSGIDRRTGEDRRKVRLTITGRAIDI